MTSSTPRFTELTPIVLDYTRVTLNLKTANFDFVPNVFFNFDSPVQPNADTVNQESNSNTTVSESLYPNLDLGIFDAENHQFSQAMNIEHREPIVALTLHIRNPQPGKKYTAKADMVHKQKIIDSVSATFILAT